MVFHRHPTVQRFVPRLMGALDRAILFCQSALTYGRAEEHPPQLVPIAIAPFLAELGAQMLLDETVAEEAAAGTLPNLGANPFAGGMPKGLPGLGMGGLPGLGGMPMGGFPQRGGTKKNRKKR